MTKPVDISKFRKSLTKSIAGVNTGFRDPQIWLSTGSYALNYLVSGDFYKGVPLGKVTVLAGESGSGKSYICSGNIVKAAQAKDIFVVLIDTENALDEKWLRDVGVDTNPEKLLKIGASMVDDVGKTISEFMKAYKALYDGAELEFESSEIPRKVLFVIDSLGMLLTPTDVNQFEKGDMKGDMGRKAKSLTALVRNTVNLIAPYDVGVVATNHTYQSQDMFSPDDKVSGGQGFVYASSILIAMKKKKLKEDENGNKVTDVKGIKASCKIMKTRYSKPFETVDVFIPWSTGMDPYSGLFDLFEKTGLFAKQGNRYRYVSKETGEEIVQFRKHMTPEFYDTVMKEFTDADFEIVVTNTSEENADAAE